MDVNRSADRRIQRFRIQTIDDRQIEVLLLLLSLLLMATPVVMMMPTVATRIANVFKAAVLDQVYAVDRVRHESDCLYRIDASAPRRTKRLN